MKKVRWILSLWVLMLFLTACGGGKEVTLPAYKVLTTKKTPIASIVMVQTALGITEEQIKLISKEIIEQKEKKEKKYRIEFYERENDILAGPTIAAALVDLNGNTTVDPQKISVTMVPEEERKGIQEMIDKKRIGK